MDKEAISTMYLLAWTVNSSIWSAAGYIAGGAIPAFIGSTWLALALIVWWVDLRPLKRTKNQRGQPAG